MKSKVLTLFLCLLVSVFSIAQEMGFDKVTEVEEPMEESEELIGYDKDGAAEEEPTISEKDQLAHRKRVDSLIAIMNAQVQQGGGYQGYDESWQERTRRHQREQESRKRPWRILKIVAIIVGLGSFIYRKTSE